MKKDKVKINGVEYDRIYDVETINNPYDAIKLISKGWEFVCKWNNGTDDILFFRKKIK